MHTASADEDMVAIVPTPVAKGAGSLLVAAGCFDAALSLQSWLLIGRVPWYALLLVALMTGMAPAAIFLGWKVSRLYGWASVSGAAVAAIIALAAASWFLFTLLNGVFSFLAFAMGPMALASTVMSVLSIPAGRRADAARSRLRDQGLEAGI